MPRGARSRSGRQRGWPARQRNSSLLVSARQLQAHVRLHMRTSSWLAVALLERNARRVGTRYALPGAVGGPNRVRLAFLVLLNSRSKKTPYITPQEVWRCLLHLPKNF